LPSHSRERQDQAREQHVTFALVLVAKSKGAGRRVLRGVCGDDQGIVSGEHADHFVKIPETLRSERGERRWHAKEDGSGCVDSQGSGSRRMVLSKIE